MEDNEENKKKKKVKDMASVGETLSFVFACGSAIKLRFAVGILFGVLHGLTFPALAYVFSNSFSDISGAASNGLAEIRELAFTFMIVGCYAFAAATVQGWCFEIVAYHASHSFRLQWFEALLRQDPAFFDVHDIGGLAAQIGPNANKFRRGVGRKMGEAVQFSTTGVGGLAYAFYASWRVAFVVMTVVPFVAVATMAVMKLNQTKGARAAASYKTAGSVAYSAVSAIKTVLSLNAIPEMISQYKAATAEAMNLAVSYLIKSGVANGSMLGSFLCLYAVLTLYGTSLLYRDVSDSGCDPSNSVLDNSSCDSSGTDVFGAMLGVAFAGQGISQVGNCLEAFSAARVAVYEALSAINRKPGSNEEVIYQKEDDLATTNHSKKSDKPDVEEAFPQKLVKAILPKYEIDSSSDGGQKPTDIRGVISFKNVHFSYPTRPDDSVLNGLSTEIEAGETCAFVGPSGSGKSTVVSMVERFYDPISGSIELDGIDLKDINVSHLRSLIGYVGQEPTLFATTIRRNIQYGNPDATFEQIEAAARMANAHDFISSFSDGYDTQVGDKGGQLSGGQKQRIAIARVLVADPKILILDEATSALDAESELVVQDALDSILEKKKITTIIIAHRLSTIRNADKINVIVSGQVAEKGTHDELMSKPTYYRKLVNKQEGVGDDEPSGSGPPSRSGSSADLTKLEVAESSVAHISFKNVHFAYPTRPKKEVFRGFNLDVAQGQTVALVGPSGGGKSTTVGLIERFYDPVEGVIEYLGADIKSLNVAWYRDQIGYVGQEPTLFNDTIARNVAYGAPGASQADIEEACKQANAHDFVIGFPDGYDTFVGARGTQLSGGQKQRIAIARALVKKPKVLILDEATSALDNESEAIVQAAIDKLMMSSDHTVVMIAHRLSTVRGADKIAFISRGKVREFGTHDELINLPNGRYKRLFESSKRDSTIDTVGLRGEVEKSMFDDEEHEEIDWEDVVAKEAEGSLDLKRARQMAAPDIKYILAGVVGALLTGGVFPMWGVLFSETINLLFRRVENCPAADGSIPGGFDSCQTYWDDNADYMKEQSFFIALYWLLVVIGCLIGQTLTFWGFGMSNERLNKRIRDMSFAALLRQEVSFFDKRSVGSITSQLQDDASRIQAFTGEPVRAVVIALSSIVIGVILSFIFMWPFALLAIGCVPLMGFATAIHMKQMLGEDQGDESSDELNSPGGIIVETLLNIRTVSALTLEKTRFADYEAALLSSEPNYRFDAFMSGVTAGISMLIQQWINGLQMWFGGYLLFNFPGRWGFQDFLISNFAILFGLFGLGAAFQDITDKKLVEESANRLFYLLDRQSEIDPTSEDGKKLE